MKMNLTMRITILCFVFLIAGIPVSDGVKEVKIDPKEGSCRATSSWSFQHNPNKACSPSQSNYWHNAKSSTLPQTLFFQSKEKVRVTRFKLEGGKDKRYYPRQFTFFGSNDEDCLREDKWEYQREFQAVSYSGVKKNLFEATTNDNNQEFRCYGIKIEKSNYHYSYAPHGWYAAVHLLEFFTSECCVDAKCKSYRGNLAKTVSGTTCRPWDEAPTHNSPQKKPNAGLDSNFCRNPSEGERAWCYTSHYYSRWEYCDIKQCAADFADERKTARMLFGSALGGQRMDKANRQADERLLPDFTNAEIRRD